MTRAKPPPGGRDPQSPLRVQIELDLGTAKREQGDLEGALEALRAAFESALTADSPALVISAGRELGLTLLAASRLREADTLLEQTLRATAEHYGTESPEWAAAAEELALARRARGDLSGALRLQHDAFETSRRALGERNPVTWLFAMNLASATNLNRLLMLPAGSLPRAARRPAIWNELPVLFLPYTTRDPTLLDRGEFETSLEELRNAWQTSGVSAPSVLFTTRVDSLVSQALTSSHDPAGFSQGYDLARRVLDRHRAELGEAHPQTLNSLQLFSRATAPRNARLAVELASEAALASESVLGRGHVDTLGAFENLAALLANTGDDREADGLRRENVLIRAADEGIIGAAQPPIENLAGTLTEPAAPMSREHFSPSLEGGGGGVPAGDSAGDRDDELVRRTAHAELNPSRPIQPDEGFEVSVYVDCAAARDPGSGELLLDVQPGTEELTLHAWLVVSRHFEVEGEAVQPLRLDLREASSPRIYFLVRAVHAQEFADHDPEVRVLFSYEGWPSGEVRLPVPLAEPTQEAAL